MFSQDLLDILVCPKTRQKLAILSEQSLGIINQAIMGGGLRQTDGSLLTEPIDQGLLREDHQILYTISDGIPIMVYDQSIPCSDLKLV